MLLVFHEQPKQPDDCRKFDPRIRPWYRTSTSVAKNVVVLIDLAASMGNNLPPDLGAGTILEAAKKIAKELLTTLSAQDYVNIIVYDSSRVIQLSRSAVILSPSCFQLRFHSSVANAPGFTFILSTISTPHRG